MNAMVADVSSQAFPTTLNERTVPGGHVKQDSRSAKKITGQLRPHLPPDETIAYVSVANIKPDGAQLAGQLVSGVLRGGHGAVLPLRRAAVFLTSEHLLVIVVDAQGKLITDETYIFPRRQFALAPSGGVFGLKHHIVDASGNSVMKVTFPIPNREDGPAIAAQLGPAQIA
jgi:hypothetical protein